MTLSAKIAAAEALFGREEQTAARTVTAIATSDSEDGLVTVSFGPEDEGAEEGEDNRIGCIGSVKQGEEVNVLIQNGDVVVLGSAGWGDEQEQTLGLAVDRITEVASGFEGIQSTLTTLDEKMQNMSGWVKIDDVHGLLIIGDDIDRFNMTLGATDLTFYDQRQGVAQITNQQLEIKKAIIREEMQIGHFIIDPREEDGSMYIAWVGN